MNSDFLTSNQLIADKKDSELFLIFNLLDKKYVVPAEKIYEIVQLPALSVIEKFPDNIVGLLNLRGQVIIVIDLSGMLGLQPEPYTTDHQVLILDCQDKSIGIVVNSIEDVARLDKKNFDPLPYKPKEKVISGLYKYENSLIAFLDLTFILENVENIDLTVIEASDKPGVAHDLFPHDEASKTKLIKRAEKLRKEARIETGNLSYQENYFISFALNTEIYCINLKHVKEITKLKLVSIVPVPCVPEFIVGIINLRGEFITIVDMKHFLQIARTNISEKTKIIVVKAADIQLGILVDEVFEIESIPHNRINLNIQTKYEKNKYSMAEVLLPDNKVMNILDLKKFTEDERLFIEDAI